LSSRPPPKKTAAVEQPKPKVIVEQVPTADVVALQHTVATVRLVILETHCTVLKTQLIKHQL